MIIILMARLNVRKSIYFFMLKMRMIINELTDMEVLMKITAGQLSRFFVAFLIAVGLTVLSSMQLSAASELKDGEYTINYEILKGDPKDDSTSLADGYWNKPATVIVKNGEIKVRTVINKDAWVVEFQTKQGSSFTDAKVVSRDSDNDSRLVEFKVSSLEEDLVTSMTVDIPSQNYYHSYETRFRFYPDTLKLVKAAESAAQPTTAPEATASSEQKSTEASTSKPSKETGAASTAKPEATANTDQKSASSQKSDGTGNKSDTTSSEGTASGSTSSSGGGMSGSTGADSSAAANTPAANADGSADTASDAGNAQAVTDEASGEQTSNDAEPANREEAEPISESLDGEMTTAAGAGETATEQTSDGAINDQEQQKGGSNALVIIIVIAVLFVVGSIIWIVRSNPRKR